MIRDAKLGDIRALVEVGGKLVKSKLSLTPDKAKILSIVTTSISSRAQKLLVEVNTEGEIEGAILISTSPFDFAEKLYAYIVAVHFKTLDIAERLIVEAMDWVEPRKGVQLVNYAMPIESGVDCILKRHGFAREGAMLIWRRYGTVQ